MSEQKTPAQRLAAENVSEENKCKFENGQQVVDKLRETQYGKLCLPLPMKIKCQGCGETFEMVTFEQKCPKCGMVHGVTPCHAGDPDNVHSAGIDY